MLVCDLREGGVELFLVLDVDFAIVEGSAELVRKLGLGLMERLAWFW